MMDIKTNNIINGYEYWYAVSAYDGIDDWAGAPVDPMENPKAKNAFYKYARNSPKTVIRFLYLLLSRYLKEIERDMSLLIK